MIERPKRSVTRFFVPLIDVLILLFCIFLLMPFVSTGEPAADAKTKELPKEEPKDIKKLQADLEKAQREIDKLKAERGSLADRYSVKMVVIDGETGGLYYYAPDGRRIYVTKEQDADDLITLHSRASGTKEPFFMIILPGPDPKTLKAPGFPSEEQQKNYARWFRNVQHRFDRGF